MNDIIVHIWYYVGYTVHMACAQCLCTYTGNTGNTENLFQVLVDDLADVTIIRYTPHTSRKSPSQIYTDRLQQISFFCRCFFSYGTNADLGVYISIYFLIWKSRLKQYFQQKGGLKSSKKYSHEAKLSISSIESQEVARPV